MPAEGHEEEEVDEVDDVEDEDEDETPMRFRLSTAFFIIAVNASASSFAGKLRPNTNLASRH